ncbi:hypothetical protein [Methanobacterium spitsbergense]|uniref:Uncharacterized protein n=1 Tax=Methanobacterium spitsbergense TaxID=2874285 RepID=A0A8T5V3R9_9EURY|nr:hypothetical protein [Methanobacterium spitsbergense]MBZ2166305.1 hypothetical protein [Methanobacterium spitsbergense]
MALQPFNGHEIAVELTAAEIIPAYSLIKFNASDKAKCNLAGAGDQVIAIVIPDPDEMMSDGNGGLIRRTGYQIGERVKAYNGGTLWVKLGAGVTAGDKCVPMAGGLGTKLAVDTFTDAAIATHDDANINAAINGLIDEIQAAAAAKLTVVGTYLATGVTTDKVPVKVKL